MIVKSTYVRSNMHLISKSKIILNANRTFEAINDASCTVQRTKTWSPKRKIKSTMWKLAIIFYSKSRI